MSPGARIHLPWRVVHKQVAACTLVKTIYTPSTYHLHTIWIPTAYYLHTIWIPSAYYLHTIWIPSAYYSYATSFCILLSYCTHLVDASCSTGAGQKDRQDGRLQLSNHLPQEVAKGPTCRSNTSSLPHCRQFSPPLSPPHFIKQLTCSMNLLPCQLDIEGVGGVPSTGEGHAQLGGGDTQHLLGCLTELGAQGFTGNACKAKRSRGGRGGD